MFVPLWPTVAISGIGGARITGTVVSTSQPTVFSHVKVDHECGKGCHSLWLFMAEVSGEPFITDAVFKGREGFGVRTVDDLVLFN